MGMNDFAPFQKINGCFIVRNVTPDRQKTIKIFNYPIPFNRTRDLLAIPGVSESDIRASLLKGELQHKILAEDIVIECSDIDLLQFNDAQKVFLENAGVVNGLIPVGGTGTGGFDVQDEPLIGIQNSVNVTFTTPTKFKHTAKFKEVVFVNGQRRHLPDDYYVAESAGPGTGYDTIVFVEAPFSDDLLIIDYFEVT